MIKKIRSSDLKPGMYIHDLNCGWLENPFLKKTFALKNEASIAKIIGQHINEVYIDTERGIDVNAAPTLQEVKEKTIKDVRKVAEEKPQTENRVSMKEELENARKIRNEAERITAEVLNDVRLGKQVKIEKVKNAVNDMVGSIFNNPHALVSLSRIKDRDQYTFNHSLNVCILMITFAKVLKTDKETITHVGIGALLHDIGKMLVPNQILNKAGKLSEEEFYIMKTHVNMGRDLLRQNGGFSTVSLNVAMEHHERFDGSGYPNGLKRDEISEFGRMSSIVDVYDAITSDRVYHKAMEPSEALRKIFEWSSFHFDRKLVESFIRSVGIFPVGTLVRLESGFLAVVSEPSMESILLPTVRVIFNIKKNRFVEPRDIDLSKNGNCAGNRILGDEDKRKWNIDPLKYLDLFNC